MKKVVIFLLALFSSVVARSANGDTFTANTVEGIEMTFKVISEANKTCQVGVGLGFNVIPAISTETTGAITVPSIVNGYQVTELAVNAFYGCSGITTINIPSSITAIGSSALEGTQWYENQPNGAVYLSHILYKWKGSMAPLTSFEIKEGTVAIAESAFRGYSQLLSIVIPQSVINIGASAFFECSSLNAINIPEGVTTIASQTFYGCKSLSTIVIPNDVTEIGASAFNGCTNLSAITILGNVSKVGQNAFKNTAWLNSQKGLVYVGAIAYKYCGSMTEGTSIDIKEGTIGISPQCFEQCLKLAAVNLPSSMKTIGSRAFWNCRSLASINIPNNVSSIGSGAFGYCTSLKSINIPNTVTTIESETFYCCSNLESLSIPGSVTDIVLTNAFYGCNSLSSISVDASNTIYDSRNNCNAIIESKTNTLVYGCNSTIIPEGVTKIGSNAFLSAVGMTEITIPMSVIEMGYNLFDFNNNAITKVIVLSKTPPIIDEATFNGVNYIATLYVPYGCRTTYQETNYWNSFLDILEMKKQKTDQSLDLYELPAMTYGDATYTLPSTTKEEQALTWTSSNTAIATISGNQLTIKKAGTATITATQEGNDDYLPFSREFTLTIGKAQLKITANDQTKQEGEDNPALTVNYEGFKYNDNASSLTTHAPLMEGKKPQRLLRPTFDEPSVRALTVTV